MLKTTVAGLLAVCAFGAQAAPLVFSSTQFETFAVASAGVVLEVDNATNPSTPLPLESSAAALSGSDSASAGAFADSGVLMAHTAVSSLDDAASAIAFAAFSGEFSVLGATHINFFIDLIVADATAASGGTLSLQLSFNGTSLADLAFAESQPISLSLEIPSAGDGLVSLFLSSDASALVPGNASNFAQAQIQITVPEPGTLALMFAAFAVLGWLLLWRRAAAPAQLWPARGYRHAALRLRDTLTAK